MFPQNQSAWGRAVLFARAAPHDLPKAPKLYRKVIDLECLPPASAGRRLSLERR
jgi:hypothetical protein